MRGFWLFVIVVALFAGQPWVALAVAVAWLIIPYERS